MYRLLAVFALISCAVADTILVPDGLDGRIVNGVNTTIQKHPYQVSLQNNSGFYLCGGSIISEDIVVTAAHCLLKYRAHELKVRLGSTKYNEGGLLVDVKAFRVHNGYNRTIQEYDVGVIKLANPVHQSTTVRYIRLAQRAPSTNTTAVVTGWGVKCVPFCTEFPEILQKVEVDIIGRRQCASSMYKYGNKIKRTMLCALVDGKGPCFGDSGSPLVVRNELVGIVSWGTDCILKDYPGVYCNVAKVRKWIEKTAQEL